MKIGNIEIELPTKGSEWTTIRYSLNGHTFDEITLKFLNDIYDLEYAVQVMKRQMESIRNG